MAEKPPPTSFSEIMQEKIASLASEVELLISNDQAELAVQRVSRGLALQPRNPMLYDLRGDAYVLTGDYPSAIQNTKKAISLSANDKSAKAPLVSKLTALYVSYGDAAYGQGNYQLALDNFRKASETDPDEREYRLKSISCLFAMELNEECLMMVEKEIADGPYYTISLLLTRAKLYLSLGRVTDCYHDVEAVLNVAGNNPVARQLMNDLQSRSMSAKIKAVDHSLMGRNREAIRNLNTAIAANPHNPYYHILRGAAHRKLLSYSLSVDDFLLAMDKCNHQFNSDVYRHASRQLVLTYNDFAMHCFWYGYYDDGAVLLNKAIKEEKGEYGLYLNRGDCFFMLKEYNFALSDFDQAQLLCKMKSVDLDYRLSVTHYALGLRAFSDKETSTALEHFTSAIKYSPYTARLYTCRARTKYEVKDIDGAKEDTLRSLLLDANCEDALPLMGRLFPGNTPEQLLANSKTKSLKLSLVSQHADVSPEETDTKDETPFNKHVKDIIRALYTPEIDIDGHNKSSVSIATSGGRTDQSLSCDDEMPVTLPPRSWAVLDLPPLSFPPDVTTDATLSLGTHSIDRLENDFQLLIYHTKRSIKEEVNRLLQSRSRFPARLKLTTGHSY